MFNVIDFIILFVLMVSTAVSVWRGFVTEAISLVTWTIAVSVASTLYSSMSYLLRGVIETDLIRGPIAWLLLLAMTIILLHFLAAVLRRWIKNSQLTGLDRALATVFGFLRGGLIVVLTVWLLHNAFPDWYTQHPLRKSSIMLHYFEPVAGWADSVIQGFAHRMLELQRRG